MTSSRKDAPRGRLAGRVASKASRVLSNPKLTVRPMFEQRVLPTSEDVIFKWRLLVEAGRKAGHTFSQPDLIIAATGLHHGMTIVTRDTSDYERTAVRLINPWKWHA